MFFPAVSNRRHSRRLRACDVATDSSTASVPGRYASALFELAQEEGNVAEVEQNLATFQSLLDVSEELRSMTTSPAYGAEEQAAALGAVLEKVGIGGITANFLKLIARNRRLPVVSSVISIFKKLAADSRGEVTAEVTAAEPLSEEQLSALKDTLSRSTGKSVMLDVRVEPEILGGLIVKLGSRMVDSSLRTRLANIQAGLKGAPA